jgi:hypothetical protein
MLSRSSYLERSKLIILSFNERLTKAPFAVPQMICAVDMFLRSPKQIVISLPSTNNNHQSSSSSVSSVSSSSSVPSSSTSSTSSTSTTTTETKSIGGSLDGPSTTSSSSSSSDSLGSLGSLISGNIIITKLPLIRAIHSKYCPNKVYTLTLNINYKHNDHIWHLLCDYG